MTGEGAGGSPATRVLGWGSLPPPVHGSASMSAAFIGAAAEVCRVDWVNPVVAGDISELGRFGWRRAVDTVRPLLRFSRLALRGGRGSIGYMNIASSGPARYRDLLVWVVGRLTCRRMIIHVHTSDLAGLTSIAGIRAIHRWLLRGTEVWVLSEQFRADMVSAGAAAVTVVENGVTCDAPDHGARLEATTRSGGKNTTLRVVFLGNHLATKGADVAGGIAWELRDQNVDWIFAGSPREEALETALQALEVLGPHYSRIKVVDEDVRCSVLSSADCLIMPSRYRNEAAPLVVLEAMEHGVIPLVSQRGVMAELVGDAGFVCADRQEFMEAIVRLKDDVALRHRLSAQASERWEKAYSAERYKGRVVEALTEVLAAASDR